MIKILLAEDYHIVRNGIRSLLGQTGDFEIIGEANNGKDALDLLKNGLVPDLVLSDLSLPVMGGLELTKALVKNYPKVKVVILTMFDEESCISEAFKAGASGYLLKGITPEEMIFAIKHVYANGRYLCSDLSMRLLEKTMQSPEQNAALVTANGIQLSTRELEVLKLIAEGHTNQEISDRLFTSKRTIEGYRKNMLEKTKTPNTAALITFAIRSGFIK